MRLFKKGGKNTLKKEKEKKSDKINYVTHKNTKNTHPPSCPMRATTDLPPRLHRLPLPLGLSTLGYRLQVHLLTWSRLGPRTFKRGPHFYWNLGLMKERSGSLERRRNRDRRFLRRSMVEPAADSDKMDTMRLKGQMVNCLGMIVKSQG